MTHQKAQQCTASFFLTLVLIVALCGLAMVDFKSDRYMPGQFGSLLQVASISEDGLVLTVLGEDYFINPGVATKAGELFQQYGSLLPLWQQIPGMLAHDAYSAFEDYREEQESLRIKEAQLA